MITWGKDFLVIFWHDGICDAQEALAPQTEFFITELFGREETT